MTATATEDVVEREAAQGEKMIEARIKFWTNDIAKHGKIRPKHAWSQGVVVMTTNQSHELDSVGNPVPFDSFAEIPAILERVLVEHDITLHNSRLERKYRGF